jgi:uncharacterized protein (UPF0548 family)
VAECRFLKRWTDAELEARLDAAARMERNFSESPDALTPEQGWRQYFSEAQIGQEPPGPPIPGGAFEKAWHAITRYEFSDPRIVTAHFEPDAELLGRRMLLELHAFGFGLRYLGGVIVGAVIEGYTEEGRTVSGYRYDTLEGHIEAGAEWFLLTKHHDTGEVWFRIQAAWRPGQFPNWWSRLGFKLVARQYQRAWHRLAYLRMRELIGAAGLGPVPQPGRLIHEGPRLSTPPITRFARRHASTRTRAQLAGEHTPREVEQDPARRRGVKRFTSGV